MVSQMSLSAYSHFSSIYRQQCCGSGMFIPDLDYYILGSGFFHPAQDSGTLN
jgi:hypothetical protein